MANPIPENVRAVTDPNILTAEEWIHRTEAAKGFLVQRHGYRDEDFYKVSDDEEPCLYGWSKYRPEWISQSGFVADQAIPRGLILHWPPGLDVTGEPHDAHDPIYLLEDAELWASMTDDEIQALCEEPAPATQDTTPAEANAKDEQAERQRATGHHEDSAPANRVVRKGSQ
ncbi:hypothetical protein [Thioclava sp. GXIMD4216]|uniref:hypothetical protein n=1 Tax=Thioclava sp. GXIMD4216 TaxID=3131929 RepID=UPI0030CE7F1C